MPKLRNWRFTTFTDQPKTPVVDNQGPEVLQTRLFGKVYDDPRGETKKTGIHALTGESTTEFANEHRVITSPIAELDLKNRRAKTRSGTVYELIGEPDPEWADWLTAQGLWDKFKDEIYPSWNPGEPL